MPGDGARWVFTDQADTDRLHQKARGRAEVFGECHGG